MTSPTPIDESVLYALDERYQLAVKENDADTMDRIHAPDMVLYGDTAVVTATA